MTFTPDFQHGPYSNMATASTSLGFPEVLDFATAYGHINRASESAPLLGVDGTNESIAVDLDSESPHVLISASVGGGKSVVGRAILAQSVASGAVGVVLDVKRISHKWAYNQSKIGYAKTIPDIGNALVELGREVHRRNEIAEVWGGPIETAPVGPRIVVLFEELNATMGQLKEMSKRIPKGTYGAMEALNDVLLLGRAAKVHIIGVMQFPDFRILGQAQVECFNVRVMLRYTKNVWSKIAFDAGFPQAAPWQTGRGMVVYGGKAREVQFLYLTESECSAMASSQHHAVQSRSVPRIEA